MITIHPYGGLCNRMRCIDSGVHLARELGQEMAVVWQPNQELNAAFEDLFCPSDSFTVLVTPPRMTARMAFDQRLSQRLLKYIFRQAGLLEVLDGRLKDAFRQHDMLQMLARYRNIYVHSEDRFMYPEVYDVFRPVDRIQRVVDAFSRRFRENTVGIHIRRKDHDTAIKESPISLFVERIEGRLAADADANFYVATDDITVKRMLVKRFGKAIITQEAELSRQTKSGVAAAVVDLYALARAGIIWGSYGSSFCETAHYLGNNDFILLRRANQPECRTDATPGKNPA